MTFHPFNLILELKNYKQYKHCIFNKKKKNIQINLWKTSYLYTHVALDPKEEYVQIRRNRAGDTHRKEGIHTANAGGHDSMG